jgi:hypothetical protein
VNRKPGQRRKVGLVRRHWRPHSHQRVRLSPARLAVGDDGQVVAVEHDADVLLQRRRVDGLLGGGLAEDVVVAVAKLENENGY